MSYSVVKNGKSTYDVVENDTDTLIRLSMSEKEVRGVCRKLNLGSGFAGYTPSFFSQKTLTKH